VKIPPHRKYVAALPISVLEITKLKSESGTLPCKIQTIKIVVDRVLI